jgi:hypothetical protein
MTQSFEVCRLFPRASDSHFRHLRLARGEFRPGKNYPVGKNYSIYFSICGEDLAQAGLE